MKLAVSLGAYPAARPLNADQILEYHAARLLLLLLLCGNGGRIEGLTKLAKLDFFVRYPVFFEKAATELDAPIEAGTSATDSTMVRHHYGPWDPRYYQVLAYLEGREMIKVEKDRRAFVFVLSPSGTDLAKQLASASPFAELVLHMKKVKKLFGSKSGDWLKKLIYQVFDDEVARLAHGEVIR